jgi:hypothetical protein
MGEHCIGITVPARLEQLGNDMPSVAIIIVPWRAI